MWFSDVAAHPDPGNSQLIEFLSNTQQFLGFVLNSDEFNFLWEDEPNLRNAAIETFQVDVIDAVKKLQDAIVDIPHIVILNHGLVGRPLRFKFAVVDSIGRSWDRFRGSVNIRDWLKRILNAIDAVLDSILDAVFPVADNPGVGGLIKEFKDALGALIKTA